MSRELHLTIPEECYEKLAELANECGADLDKLLESFLEGLSLFKDSILVVKRERPSLSLRDVFEEIFLSAEHGRFLVKQILRNLGVEKGFMFSDADFALIKRYAMLWFDAAWDCELLIDSFDITWRGKP